MVYLALAPRRRYRRRDDIKALLWPELDEEHARGALNQAIHYLRAALGGAVLMSQGGDEVALDPASLWCDAVALSAAGEAQRHEEAVTRTRVLSLHGFFVEDAAPEYQEWVESERSGFRNLAAHAAVTLAAAAEQASYLAGAVRYARRAATIVPDDEAVAARLIRVLDRSGDRVGALTAYESLRQRLNREFQAAPSPETEALMAKIRSR